MRQRRRRFPTIRLDKKVSYACYDWVKNEIVFGIGVGTATDSAIMYILIHEIEHFAQNMFLDKQETDLAVCGFNGKHYFSPFVEYIMANPGKYDFSAWEEKYNRGVSSVDWRKM